MTARGLAAAGLPRILAIAFALLVTAFVGVGWLAASSRLVGLDGFFRDLALSHSSSGATAFFSVATTLGSKAALVAIGVVGGWWLSNRSLILVALVALCGYMSAELVDAIKVGFDVARPAGGMASQRSLSFPSGHVAGSSAIVTLLIFVSWRCRRAALRIVTILGTLLVGVIAVSRVYLDKHWVSDTIGGALVGTAIGVTFAMAYEAISRSRTRGESNQL
jgi:membrane-associated phospholipid phosphatase